MRIIVASDTHYRNDILDELINKYKDADLFIHCGDLEDDPQWYPQWIFVRGNNDYFVGFEDERIIEVQGHRILVLHSHRCSFLNREETLVSMAYDNGCDIVLYGHTHVSKMTWKNGIFLMNPGSTTSPRDGKTPSYGILTIDGAHVEGQIVHREDW